MWMAFLYTMEMVEEGSLACMKATMCTYQFPLEMAFTSIVQILPPPRLHVALVFQPHS